MTLKDFDREIAKELDMSPHSVRKVIASLEKQMLKKLIFGQEVVITRIGKFIQTKRQERTQHNVNTGKLNVIPKHYKIQFKTTPSLDSRMKAKTVH